MTTLDTFTIDFKTKSTAQAQAEIASIDKQLAEMDKNGKKRTEDENKQYLEAKKRRKELLDETKSQQRETDKLSESFQGMIQNAVGAVTAYASFGFLKNALIDANKLNTSLQILGQTYGLSGRDVKAFGAAVERSTGIPAQAAYGFLASGAAQAARDRVPFNPTAYIQRIRDSVKNLPAGAAQTLLQQLPGDASSLLPYFQLSEGNYAQAQKEGLGVAGTEADFKAAQENEKSALKVSQELGKVATQIDTAFAGAIKDFNEGVQKFIGIFSGSPGLGTVEGGLLGVGGTIIAGKSIGALARGIFGGATAGASTAGGGAFLGGAAALAALASIPWVAEAAGTWIGNKLKGGAATPSGGSSAQQHVQSFWQSQGYSPGAAAGWTANAQQESSFNPLANNGSHGGIYQWSQTRRAKILAETNIDVWKASLDDQLKAAAWEANSMGLAPGAFPNDAGQSAAIVSNRFEIPSTTASGLAAEAAKRAQVARGYAIASATGEGRTINIKIDDIKIETAATDAAGIASAVGVELKNQIRMAMSNIDDGTAA